MPFVLVVVAPMQPPIGPLRLALSSHLTQHPYARIYVSVSPNQGTLSMKLAATNFSFIAASWPLDLCKASLLSHPERAFKARSITPYFFTHSILLVMPPLALVDGAILPNIAAKSMRPVSDPLSIIGTSIGELKPSMAVCKKFSFHRTLITRIVRQLQDNELRDL
eukprot:CAMPEP_0181496532 /NCGR_PEP_ID=MMETSP1110-20121109/53033_1 /TAXON_ID=174948 /ORGANISM="Symbiodinium sp., Strain CCMP421" /LENGTH=164 /DNA_ID=CAMNT_0023624373 /DNA_START=192 /DNA_END=686 /DNA_ORIENTATION=+